MSNEYEFDKTRNAIGANSMSDDERGAMLKKFKSSGGEILKEKTVNDKPLSSSRRSASGGGGRDFLSKAEQRALLSDSDGDSDTKKISKKIKKKKNKKLQTGFLDVFLFKFRSALSGTTNITGTKVKATFIKFIMDKLKPGLLILHGNLNYFFLGEQKAMQSAIRELDEENPIFLEVLDHIQSLYDVADFNAIDEAFKKSSDGSVQISQIIEPIKTLYLKLYYLSSRMSMANKAFNLLYQAYVRESTEKKDVCALKAKEVVKVLNSVLNHAFKNYFLIICCEAATVFEPISKAFQNYIGFDPEKTLGQRVAGEACKAIDYANQINNTNELEAENLSGDSDEPTPDEEADEGDDPITQTQEYQYGKSLMGKFGPKQMRKKYDESGHYSYLQDLDKIFLSMMYFKEFDFEYSPILTTKQIHFNIDGSYGVKKDYSKILPEIASSSRTIDQAFEEYYHVTEDLRKLEEISGMNYIEQSKRETALQSKICSQSSVVKGATITYLYKVVSSLATLIASMKEKKNIVENIEDVLSLGGELDRKKKMSGKTVKQGIIEAYCYSLALKYQIEDGHLKGLGLLNNTQARRLLGDLASMSAESTQSQSTTEGLGGSKLDSSSISNRANASASAM